MKIGIIGYGSMGTAISQSIEQLHGKTKFIVSFKSKSIPTNSEVAQKSNNLFLCIKPNDAKKVCQEIQGHINKKTVVISIMAGIPFNKLQEWLNHENVVKVMPTISLPKGPVVIYNPLNLKFKTFSKNNILIEDEQILDMSTSISGCMPGFLANIFEQWIDAAIELGMDRKLAEKLVCSNASAFGDLNITNKIRLQEIQFMVSSKGGATEKGLVYLNGSNLDQILGTTMKLANNRILDLTKNLRE